MEKATGRAAAVPAIYRQPWTRVYAAARYTQINVVVVNELGAMVLLLLNQQPKNLKRLVISALLLRVQARCTQMAYLLCGTAYAHQDLPFGQKPCRRPAPRI